MGEEIKTLWSTLNIQKSLENRHVPDNLPLSYLFDFFLLLLKNKAL